MLYELFLELLSSWFEFKFARYIKMRGCYNVVFKVGFKMPWIANLIRCLTLVVNNVRNITDTNALMPNRHMFETVERLI